MGWCRRCWVSALSVLAYNFFFLPPLYQFTISDPANVVALFFFMFVAIAASALAARTRSQTEAARREARTTAELYAFSRKIAGVVDLYDLLWIVVTHLARLLNAEVVILMPPRTARARRRSAAFPPDGELERGRPRRGRWSWDADRPTGRGTDTLPGARWLFVPIRTSRVAVGVIGVLPIKRGPCARAPPSAGCSMRWATRPPSPSSACTWPTTSTRRGWAPSASACARPC